MTINPIPVSVRHLVIACGGTGARIAAHVLDAFLRDAGGTPPYLRVATVDARPKPEVPLGQGARHIDIPQPIDFPAQWELCIQNSPELVRSWWPKDVRPDPYVGFFDGCGAIRANGRFFAMYYGGAIVNLIQDCIRELAAIDIARENATPEYQVWIVGSLGNGTCGGAFMNVATLATNAVRQITQLPVKVTGLFVPSSTTASEVRGGNNVPRVGANGIASLIELQYEYNRAQHRAPHQFGARPTRRATAPVRNGETVRLPSDRDVPIDHVYLVDARNERGDHRSFEEVVSTAGHALHALIGNQDSADRTLDLQAHKDGLFAGLGYARMRSPVREGVEYAALNALRRFARSQYEPNLRNDDKLLARICTFPDTKAPADIDIESSVRFFLEQVARVWESDTEDQLVPRLRDRFPEAPNLRAMGPASPGDVEGLRVAVEDHVKGCATRAQSLIPILLDGEKDALDVLKENEGGKNIDEALRRDKWKRVGFRNLLRHHVVGPLVDAGAFSLLHEWLEVLVREITNCRTSVTNVEQNGNSNAKTGVPTEYDAAIADAERHTNNIFRRLFRRADLQEHLDEAVAELEGGIEKGRTFVAAGAAISFYNDALKEVEAFRDVAGGIRPAIRQAFGPDYERKLDSAARALDPTRRQGNGDVEIVVGDLNDATRAFEEFIRNDGLSTVLAGMNAHNRSIFHAESHRLGLADQAILPNHEEGGQPPSDWLSRWFEALETRLRTAVTTAVGDALNLQRLLERVAERELSEFIEIACPAIRDHRETTDPAARAKIASMKARRGSDYDAFLRQVRDYRTIGEIGHPTRKNLIRDLVADQIDPLQRRALPCLRSGAPRNVPLSNIDRRTFVVVRTGMRDTALGEALARKLGAGNQGLTESDSADPNRVDVVSVAFNYSLEDLHDHILVPHLDRYRTVMRKRDDPLSRGFSPHTTIEYEEAGHKFLRWLDRIQTHGTQNVGATLALLALHEDPELSGAFGLAKREGRDIVATRDIRNGGRIEAAIGVPLGTGGESGFAERMNNDEDLAAAVAATLWADFVALVNGANDRPGLRRITRDDLAERLDRLASRIEARQGETNDDARTLTQAAEGIRRIADDIRNATHLDTPPSLLNFDS